MHDVNLIAKIHLAPVSVRGGEKRE